MNYFDDDFGLNKATWQRLDDLYKSLLRTSEVLRLEKSGRSPHILDKTFHIDVILKQENGTIFTVQEKVRRHKYLKYDQWTLEYYSNVPKKVEGEWFKLCTDLYTYIFLTQDEESIARGYIFWVQPVKYAILHNKLRSEFKIQHRHSKASFFAYNFSDFKDEWFLWRYPNSVEGQLPVSQFNGYTNQ